MKISPHPIHRSGSGARWTLIDYLLVVVASGLLVLTLGGGPSDWSFLPNCPLREASGWYCAGCGGTRALQQLLKGEIATAFGLNPLLLVTLPLLALAPAWRTLSSSRPRPSRNAWWLATLALVVLAAFSVLRNLQSSPFGWMAP